jgi:hypothetical protein
MACQGPGLRFKLQNVRTASVSVVVYLGTPLSQLLLLRCWADSNTRRGCWADSNNTRRGCWADSNGFLDIFRKRTGLSI